MKVLVTGANGLLGGNLIRELLTRGHEVRALVRPQSHTTTLEGLNVERVVGDVRNREDLVGAAKGCEIVFHTAAVFSYWGHSSDEMMQTARDGSIHAVEAVAQAGARRLVLTSSTAIFGGNTKPEPFDENAPLVREGDDVPEYFVSKAVQETIAFEHAHKCDVECVAVNPTVIIGPFDYRPSSSLAVITAYLRDPLKLTYPGGASLVHAEDVAKAHVLAAEQGASMQRYICGGENCEWGDIHRAISRLAGCGGPRLSLGGKIAVLGATAMEWGAAVTKKPPLATRDMAKQSGRYFWYTSKKLQGMGWDARSMDDTLIDTLGWFATSPHATKREAKRLRKQPALKEAIARYEVHG